MDKSEMSGLTIEELSTAVDVPIRTIRYYIGEGLIAGPTGRGKAAVYGPDQVARLQLIRRLASERLPLAEIKERLAGLSTDDVAALLREEETRSSEIALAKGAPSPKEYIAALLRNARAGREPSAGRVPTLSAPSAPAPRRSIEEEAAFPFEGLRRSAREPGEPWQHWELAPGLVLQASAEARLTHADLIDRLLREAREHLRHHQP
jgi:DNA-binding transcriptional MerR regulator